MSFWSNLGKSLTGAATSGLAIGVGFGVAKVAYEGIKDFFGYGKDKAQNFTQSPQCAAQCPRGGYNAYGQYMRDGGQDMRIAALERRMAMAEYRQARGMI